MVGEQEVSTRRWKQLEALLLALLILLALWPVWANAYYLTNDGPCHLYNARMLRDMLLGNETAFYGEWYLLNPNVEPNWLNHFLLVAFQMVLPPIASEKLFLTLYILGFAFGFRYLARSIYSANSAMVMLALPFIFHKVFLMGFFNFSASIVIFFFLVGFWLRYRAQLGWRKRLGLGLLMLLLLLSHPVSYCMAMGLIALHWVGELVQVLSTAEGRQHWRSHLQSALGAALAAVPSLVLIGMFVVRQAGTVVPSAMKQHKLFHDFLELRSLVLFQESERPWPMALAILIGVLTLAGFFVVVRRARQHEGILVMFGLAVMAYFMQPAQVGRVGIVPERLQFFPYLIALCWIVTLPWPKWVQQTAMAAGFVVAGTLFAMRLPDYARTSDAVSEFMTVSDHIAPKATVLMLNYAPEGRLPNDGEVLSREAYIFMHVTEYIGALQPAIILNNYEANTSWFPLRWRSEVDPYMHLADGPGFEGWLPTADFEQFRNQTGKDVDYVLQWCRTQELLQYEGTQLMQSRLEKDYQETFISNGQRIRLWQRKR